MSAKKRINKCSEDSKILELVEKRRKKLLQMGFWGRPALYFKGDRVGFFFSENASEFKFGRLLAAGKEKAKVLADDGMAYIVSPFSLFAVLE